MADPFAKEVVDMFAKMADTAAKLVVAKALHDICKRANDRFVMVVDILDVARAMLETVQTEQDKELPHG